MKKNKVLSDKTEHALHQHSMSTILVGRFAEPTRPLVPMVVGAPDLPVAKFIVPNIIGCVLWPSFYLLSRTLAGVTTDIHPDTQSGDFRWLLLATAMLPWVGGRFCWRLWRSDKTAVSRLTAYFLRNRLLYLTPLTLGIGAVALVALLHHPLMPVHIDILRKVVGY